MQRHGYRLPKMAWWLLVVSGFFHLSISLSNTFVNIFVFKVDHSFAAIAWYNLMVYLLLPFTFVFAAWIARKTSTAMAMRIGIVLHAVFYAVTLSVGERAAKMPILLGILMGIAAGFYWLAFDVLSVEYTDRGGHEPFFGIFGVLTSVANVVAPPVAGLLISREDAFLGGFTGYHIVFGMSFALFVGATVFSMRLKSDAMPKLSLHKGLAALRKRAWARLMIASSMYGLREGVFMFLIGLLVFLATGSELRLGEFLLLQGGLSFVAFYLAGRWSTKARARLFLMGAIGMSVAACLFLLPIQTWTIVLYGCLISATIPFFLVPMQGYVYDGMEAVVQDDAPTTTHIIVREWFENLGRTVGIVLFLLICSNQSPRHLGKLSWLSFGLGFVQLATVALIVPIERRLDKLTWTTSDAERHEEVNESKGAAKKRLNPMS